MMKLDIQNVMSLYTQFAQKKNTQKLSVFTIYPSRHRITLVYIIIINVRSTHPLRTRRLKTFCMTQLYLSCGLLRALFISDASLITDS